MTLNARPVFRPLPLVIFSFLLLACQSTKNDVRIDTPREALAARLLEAEEEIVALDNAADRTPAAIEAARKNLAALEMETRADADFTSRVQAWSGRLALLDNKASEAGRLLRESENLSPGNLPALILGIRLEPDTAKRLELIDREIALAGPASFSAGLGELQIERGRTLFELRRFSEAAGAYDTAFAAGLPEYYRAVYQAERNRAWELRAAGGRSGSLAILEKSVISWKDSIELAKNETRLLLFLSAGRDLTETELFNRLLDRSFIPYTQDINLGEWPKTKPKLEDRLQRSGAAWFIWHLYAEARADKTLLSRYSARFGGNPRSPIADLPPLSPFLDSILGVVETEILSLPDGRNFRPAEAVSAAELLSALKKIRN